MLTSAQEQRLLGALSAHLADEINGTGFGPMRGRFGMRGLFRHAGPPMRLFPSVPVPPGPPPAPSPVY